MKRRKTTNKQNYLMKTVKTTKTKAKLKTKTKAKKKKTKKKKMTKILFLSEKAHPVHPRDRLRRKTTKRFKYF